MGIPPIPPSTAPASVFKPVSNAYTVLAADAKATLLTSDTAAVIHTLPDIGAGTEVSVVQGAAGVVTFTVASNGNLVSLGGKGKTAGQYARVRAQQFPSVSRTTGGSGQFLFNWNPSTQMVNAKAAAQKAVAKTGLFRAAFAGDSTTAGVGSASTNWRATSAPSFFASDFANYAPVLAGIASAYIGTGNAGVPPGNCADTRITLSGNAQSSGAAGFGGPVIQMGVGDGASFNFGSAPFDTVRLIYINQGNSVNIGLDGNAPTSAAYTSGTNTNAMIAQSFTVPRGVHTVQAMAISGTLYLQAVEVWDSTLSQVQVLNGGSGGADSSVLSGPTTQYSYINGLLKETPNVAFLNFGINDLNNGTVNATQFRANVDGAVVALQGINCDVVLVMPEDVTSTGYQNGFQAFLDNLKSISSARNVPLFDMHGYFGTRASQQANGWVVDSLHSNATFYQLVGDAYAQMIAVGTGYGTTAAQNFVTSIQGSAGAATMVPVWHLSGDLA